MTNQATIAAPPAGRLWAVAGWACAGLLLGCTTALAGLPVFYAILALASIIIFASLATRFPSAVMIAAVWALALCPFSFGAETGVLPKLFADEVMLLLYLLVLAPIYWTTTRVWQKGFRNYFWLVGAFVCCQALSLAVRTDLIAFRNLLETYILGPMLLVVFLQEAANTDGEDGFANAIAWLVAVIAVISVVEKVMQRNPLLEHLEMEQGFQYLSPRIVAITEGTYRPYATFFHPSETGTFMAMGLPYAIRRWSRSRSWVAAFQILLILAGLGVNATRGVWVAVAVSLLLLAKNPLKILVYTLPTVSLLGGVAYIALKSTAFMQRVTDANNLLGRFIYWRLGIQVFSDSKILGVGHMQFQKLYLDYVHEVSEIAQLSLTQIQVIDNAYLTTLVEHGVIGLLALVALLVCTGLYLKRTRLKLVRMGLLREASLVRMTQLVLVIYAVSGFFADVNQFTKATKFLFILVGFGLGVGARAIQKAKNEDVASAMHGLAEGQVVA